MTLFACRGILYSYLPATRCFNTVWINVAGDNTTPPLYNSMHGYIYSIKLYSILLVCSLPLIQLKDLFEWFCNSLSLCWVSLRVYKNGTKAVFVVKLYFQIQQHMFIDTDINVSGQITSGGVPFLRVEIPSPNPCNSVMNGHSAFVPL